MSFQAIAGIQRVLEVCLEIRSGSPIKDFGNDSEGHSRESGNP